MNIENSNKKKEKSDREFVIFSTFYIDPMTGRKIDGVDILVGKDDPYYEKLRNEPFVYNERPMTEDVNPDITDYLDVIEEEFKKPILDNTGNAFEKL